MNIKYRLVVTALAGLNIIDTPRPRSQGSIIRRSVGVGTILQAYDIIKFSGVEYAQLVPQKENFPEWVRCGEIGGEQYVKQYTQVSDGYNETGLVEAIKELTQTIKELIEIKKQV